MGKTWSNQAGRATRGLGIAVTVGLLGSAVTAVVLANMGANFGENPERDDRGVPTVPWKRAQLPENYAPRADVLAYSALSDKWAATDWTIQEDVCVRWMGMRGQSEATVLADRTRIIADWSIDAQGNPTLHTPTVRQFFDETCPGTPMIGTAESMRRK